MPAGRFMKQKIIHFIFNLGRGGAETMLVRVIKELPEYEHVVVTLFPMNHWGNELQADKLVCLNLSSLFSLPFAVFKFRKVIKKERPAIVHTHLFWPTVIARLSVPKRIPLITTIHAFIKTSIEYKNWHVRLLDKLTYRFRKNIIIGVAKGVTEEYFSLLKLQPYKAYTLYTFVDTARFNTDGRQEKISSPTLKVVSVGALRQQKNYPWSIKAFEKIKDHDIELHIYGVGNLQEELQKTIDATGAKIFLKGEIKNVEVIIPQYDLYLMSSSYEGFSLSVLEAMAMGMPLLLSDISSFREQGEDTAAYFSLTDEQDLPAQLIAFSKKPKEELSKMAEKGRQRAIQHFTLPQHIEGLRKIYTAAQAAL
jgi:glycosyltransferase involved in cell wall biosynthesis